MDLSESPMSAGHEEAKYLAPVYAQMSFEPVAGVGPWLKLADGRKLLDFYGGHAVAGLGYGHAGLLTGIKRQMDALLFQSNAAALSIRAEAARRLLDFTTTPFAKLFFVNSGAEANENALRLAIKTTGRTNVVAVEGGFHGRTAAAGAVTHGAVGNWYGFPQTPFPVSFVPRNDRDALEHAVDADTAAIIVEPVQGLAGAVDLDREFLHAMRSISQDSGTLLIFDEVQCGMGRTGFPFAADLYELHPDLLTTAKSLGGGFPCGAVFMSEAVAGGISLGDLGSTFGGGPLACAAMIAVVEAIESEGLLGRVRDLSERIRQSCRFGVVSDIQGAGFLLGLRTSRPAKEVKAELLSRNILVGGSTDPFVVRLLPPLNLQPEHVELLAQALGELTP